MDELLDMLGNETRRGILQLLSERPCYVSELSQQLNIGQKAIIEHLELMRQLGILEARLQKIEKGRPRKYFGISQDVILEVRIGQDDFNVQTLYPDISEDILKDFPNLREVNEQLKKMEGLQGERRIENLEMVLEELDEEHRKITNAKKVLEYLRNRVRYDLKKEMLEEEMRNFF
jgi:ArsR family transcriptional regulator